MDFNKELYRNISSGLQFEKYFEKVKGNEVSTERGDTTDALYLIEKTAKKYAYQTKKIAQVLQASTIQQTVNNIYQFLYSNIQYKIDDFEYQTLKSPAHSWQNRAVGIDCKSYAIFASSILINLNIPHSIRKVKQRLYNPNSWSHVYVAINGKNKLVIDPTIKGNNEVDYVQKKDLNVKLTYHTLNAGAAQSVLANEHQKYLKGFFEVRNILSKTGVSETTLQQIENKVKTAYYKYGNFDFPFKLLPNDILLVDGAKIPLFQNGLNAGLYGAIQTSYAGIDTSMFNTAVTPQTSQLVNYNTSSPGIFSSGGAGTAIATNLASQSGSKLVAAGASLLTDPTGISAIMTLLPIGDIMAEATNVLKYGLSSYGASSDPAKEAIKVKDIYMPLIQQRLTSLQSSVNTQQIQTNLNEVERIIKYYAEYGTASVKRRSWAGSTTAAFKYLSETFTDFYNSTIPSILNSLRSAGYTVNENTTSTKFGDIDNVYMPNIPDDSGHTTAEKNGSYSHKYYTISGTPTSAIVNTIQTAITPTQTATAAQTYQTDTNVVSAQNANTNTQPITNTSSTGKIIGYGAAAALAGFLVVPMLNGKTKSKLAGAKKPVRKKKPTRKKKQ